MVQLGLLIIALVMIIVFGQQFAEGAAGCFSRVAGQPDVQAPSSATNSPVESDEPSFTVKIPKKSKDSTGSPETGPSDGLTEDTKQSDRQDVDK